MDLSLFFVYLFLIVIVLIPIAGLIFLVWISSRRKRRQEYGVKSVTLRGEQVKSLAERRIADYFEKNNIRYVYEQEARTKALFFNYKISAPDFYLPDYGIYVEYWGLVNVDDSWTRTQYIRNMRRKMAIYHRNNIRFISIYPENLGNLDWIFRAKFKKVTGFELPN